MPLRQPIGGSLVLDLLDLFTQTQLVKIVVQEQEPVAFLARRGSRLTNLVQQFSRHRLDLCMAIGFLLAQDMPDDDEQFSRNGHNRFLSANARGQALKLGFPVRMMLDGHPGRLNHDPTQITTPLLGDAPPRDRFPQAGGRRLLNRHSPPDAWLRETG